MIMMMMMTTAIRMAKNKMTTTRHCSVPMHLYNNCKNREISHPYVSEDVYDMRQFNNIGLVNIHFT